MLAQEYHQDGRATRTYRWMSVRKGSVSDRQSFIEGSVVGFRDTGRSRVLLHALPKIATSREDISLNFAMLDDEIAGTADFTGMNTSMGKVSHIYLDSILPEHRGRAVHLALVQAWLRDMTSGSLWQRRSPRPGVAAHVMRNELTCKLRARQAYTVNLGPQLCGNNYPAIIPQGGS
jgi:hypothetical protein